MLHEVIYALAGFPGDVVIAEATSARPEHRTKLRLAEDIPLLEKSERACLDRVLELGSASLDLELLAKRKTPSLYMWGALAESKETVHEFRSDVLEIERKLLADKLAGCTQLELELAAWRTVLPAAVECLEEALEKQLAGTGVLRFFDSCASEYIGDLTVERFFERTRRGCRGALCEQLRGWLGHGRITDRHGEFFLTIAAEADDDAEGRAAVDPNRLPPWMTPSGAEDIAFAGNVLIEMRRRGQHQSFALMDEHVLGVAYADSHAKMQLAVSAIRERANEGIHSLVPDGAVAALLDQVRNVYLMGRGILWDLFFEEMDRIHRGTFAVSAANRAAEEVGLRGFTFVARDGQLSPKLDLAWPYSEILRPEDEEKYSQLFILLLSLRSALLRLRSAWIPLHRRGLRTRLAKAHPADLEIQLLLESVRAQMTSLLENLVFYFHMDVIETNLTALRATLHSEGFRFLSCMEAHRLTVQRLVVECFINSRVISSTLTDIVQQVYWFVKLVEERESLLEREGNIHDSDLPQRAMELAEDYRRSSALLFQLVSSVKAVQGSTMLARLILRLDANGFYSALIARGLRRT